MEYINLVRFTKLKRYQIDIYLVHSENQALLFSHYVNSRHPNIRFTMEREIDHKIHFFFFMISNDTHFLVTSVYRKKTFTGLLSNYFSFTSHSYKLIRTLVDRSTTLGYEDITKLTNNL